MCLILVAWKVREGLPLVVAANRDEFHARAAAGASFWQDHPRILGGRDLEAQGTWMAVSRSGKFASVTNYRGGRDPNALESRGALVTRFLEGDAPPAAYVGELADRLAAYSGFNLLAADGDELWWVSNRGGEARSLAPGVYALGNFLLDSEDVAGIRTRFADCAVAIEPLFGLLATARIVNGSYGTRCSTVLLAGADGCHRFAERAFDAQGGEGPTLRFEFRAAS